MPAARELDAGIGHRPLTAPTVPSRPDDDPGAAALSVSTIFRCRASQHSGLAPPFEDAPRLPHTLVRRVINQARRRVFGGDTHVAEKVLSVFEPHTEAIRKGKVAKPTEFGKLVTVQEAEH